MAPLPFKTDIHCHLIPGVDDGSPDVATSMKLIKRMKSWGIERILSSPHVTEETFENSPETLEPPYRKLRKAMDADPELADFPLGYHSEYRIDDLLMKRIEENRLSPLPNNYILIENSFYQEPWNIDQLVFDLQVKGYRPILAHPERYSYYYTRLKRLRQLRDAGLMIQINLLSLAGSYGRAEQKFAEKLIDEGLVDFVGTDLHREAHARTIENYLYSKLARKHFAKLQGRLHNDTAFK